MTTVVLGGSRQISRLTEALRERFERIVSQRLHVVIGDANGADKAMQRFLAERAYADVEVFCSGATPRNNLGQWPCRRVETKARPGTFEFYAAKDQAMAQAANVGFMLWDGASVGTMMNVWRLLQSRKSTLVFVEPTREFVEVRGEPDWQRLLSFADDAAKADLAKRIRGEGDGAPKSMSLFGPDLQEAGLS